jgi:hypothetical protein
MAAYEEAVKVLYQKEGLSLMTYERAIRTKGRDHMQVQCVPVPAAKTYGAQAALSDTVKRLGNKCYTHSHRSSANSNRTYQPAPPAKEAGTEEGKEVAEEPPHPLVLHELDSDETRGVEEIVSTMTGGPYPQYFHVSIPAAHTVEAPTDPAAVVEGGEAEHGSSAGAAVDGGAADAISEFAGVDLHQKRYVYVHQDQTQMENTFNFPMQIGSDIASAVLREEGSSGHHWKHKKASAEEEEALAEAFKALFKAVDFTEE